MKYERMRAIDMKIPEISKRWKQPDVLKSLTKNDLQNALLVAYHPRQ